MERGDAERKTDRGGEKTRLEGERIDERGVEGQPCSWFQQSPQTRESIMGDVGDSNWVKGVLRGGWRKRRLDVSSKGVEREEHAAQKMPPHLRQCYDLNMRKMVKKELIVDLHVCVQRERNARDNINCHR